MARNRSDRTAVAQGMEDIRTIGTIGAAQSRLEFASTNLTSIIQNVTAAESVIRDADMAYEMTVFTKTQILQSAGTAMLAQANQSPQGILQLLRG